MCLQPLHDSFIRLEFRAFWSLLSAFVLVWDPANPSTVSTPEPSSAVSTPKRFHMTPLRALWATFRIVLHSDSSTVKTRHGCQRLAAGSTWEGGTTVRRLSFPFGPRGCFVYGAMI